MSLGKCLRWFVRQRRAPHHDRSLFVDAGRLRAIFLVGLLFGLTSTSDAAPIAVAAVSATPSSAMRETSNANVTAEIERVLRTHYARSAGDPHGIVADLAQLARYYARFPNVVQLIKALDDHQWQLKYKRNAWTTQVAGTRLGVRKVVINFDLRSGAQLKFQNQCNNSALCLISPADTLLHELLHADSMFNDTATFLADGGLNGVLYPYLHESRILRAEYRLYKYMTKLDGQPRPLRWVHQGKVKLVSCAICIK